MFYIDFAIIALLLLKFIVFGIVAIAKREKKFMGKYCHPFEIVLCALLSHSILLFTICQSLALRFQKINERSPSPIGANVQQIQVLENNIDNLCDLLVLQTLFFGIFIVHYSQKAAISYRIILPTSERDERKVSLEKRGFLSTAKVPYVYYVVSLS